MPDLRGWEGPGAEASGGSGRGNHGRAAAGPSGCGLGVKRRRALHFNGAQAEWVELSLRESTAGERLSLDVAHGLGFVPVPREVGVVQIADIVDGPESVRVGEEATLAVGVVRGDAKATQVGAVDVAEKGAVVLAKIRI